MVIIEVFNAKDPSKLEQGLALTYKYRGDLALIGLYAVSSFYFLFRSISELLNSITLKKLIHKKINKVYFNYFLIELRQVWEIQRKTI